jgi:anti-sigma factor ChrR (cupin superfamily)
MSAKRTKPAPRHPARKARTMTGELLSEDEAMLALAAPMELPRAHIKDQLMTRIRATRAVEANVTPAGWKFESASADTGWRSGVFPGVHFKTLSVDETRDVVMVLMKMDPGARFPDHVHDDGPDEGIVISGDVITGGRLMRAGDYYFAAEGTTQADTVSPSGCTALVSLTARSWKKWRQHMASR